MQVTYFINVNLAGQAGRAFDGLFMQNSIRHGVLVKKMAMGNFDEFAN